MGSASSCERDMAKCRSPVEYDLLWAAYVPFLLFFTALGLVGNTLVVVVKASRHMTSTSVLIVSLAVSDTLTFLTFAWTYVPLRAVFYYRSRVLYDMFVFALKEFGYLDTFQRFCKSLSSWIIVLITVERFVAVWKPLKVGRLCTRRKTLLMIFSITCLLALYWSPRVFHFRKTRSRCSACLGDYAAAHKIPTEVFIRKLLHGSKGYVAMMVDFTLPLSILFVLNFMIILALAVARTKRSAMTGNHGNAKGSHGNAKTSNDETKMLLAVVCIFVLLETPVFTMYVFQQFELSVVYTRLLSPVNSSINFLLYVAFGRNFRRDLKKMFCCGKMARTTGSSSATVTSATA